MEPNADVNTNPADNQAMPLPEPETVPETIPAPDATPAPRPAPEPKVQQGSDAMTAPLIEPKKKSRAMLLCVILLALVAIGGIVFGAVTMVQKNQQAEDYDAQIATLKKANAELMDSVPTVDGNGETVVVTQDVVSGALAQTIINPFVKSLTYMANILDYDFSDDVRAAVAFNNLPEYSYTITESDSGIQYTVSYDTLNNEVQYLFGTDLPRRDLDAGYTASFTYNDSNWATFTVRPFMGGGAGLGMFTVVKDAYYNDSNLEVEVYHDKTGICGLDEDNSYGGYCIDAPGQGADVKLIADYNMQDLIANFASRIPVYKMIFTENAGHYVLTDIQK